MFGYEERRPGSRPVPNSDYPLNCDYLPNYDFL